MINFLLNVGVHILESDPTPTPMTDLLAAATSLFTWTMTQLGSVITTITGSPILLLGFLMALVGFVIGITRRLMNLS
jgi:hypothetical protein